MRGKKYIAPVVVAALFLLYYIGIAVLFAVLTHVPLVLRLLLTVGPLLLGSVVILVLVQRIREIKSGEEDDLDRY